MRVLIFTLLIFFLASPLKAESAWNWNSMRMSASRDINGDGRPESIRLEGFEKKDRNCYFRLNVNGRILYDSSPGVGKVIGFLLADIDKSDRYKEIVVIAHGYQSSDWPGYSIYFYDGRQIRRVTKQPLMKPKFPGDGRVLTYEYLGHLFAEIPYYLQVNHTLKRAQQKYFRSEVDAVVKQPFPIYTRPALQRIAMLPKGTRVRILKSDLGNWLYLRAGRSTYGWMNTQWNNQYTAFGWAAAG